MIRKISFVLVALSMPLIQQFCFAADAKLNEERNAGQQAFNDKRYNDASRAFETALRRMESKPQTAQTDVASCCLWLGNVYSAQGQYGKAEPFFEKSLAIYEKVRGPNHPDTATSINFLAGLYRTQKRYQEAEPLYRRAIAIFERALGPEHRSTATSINDLAGLYCLQGRYQEAEPMLKRALTAYEIAPGADHPATATIIYNLARLYDYQVRYLNAEPLYKRSLAIREKTLGHDHRDTATSMSSLASLYKAEGRYPEAEPLYKRALAIDERILGPNHPDIATDLDYLASLYEKQGRYPEAEPLYKRALAIDERTLGPNHPEVATDLDCLASLYKSMGRYSEAESLYKKELAISEKNFGSDHHDTTTSISHLASLYKVQERYPEAEPLYKRALAIDERILGPNHPDIATDLDYLASLYKAMGRYSEAESLYKKGLAISEKNFGSDHHDTTTSISHLASLYKVQGRYPESETLYKRALAIDERTLGPNHPEVATDLDNLASLYEKQGRYPEAEPLYKRALAIDERTLGPNHPEVATDLDCLASLYKSMGRYSEAESLYKKELAISEKNFGSDHHDTTTSISHLASLYKVQERYPEAESLYKRALAIDERTLGPNHPDIATDLDKLASLYEKQGRYHEAEPLYKRALAIDERTLGPNHPGFATDLEHLASLFETMGRFPEAEPLYRRALAIDEKALGPNHPDIAADVNDLASLYSAQGRYSEAELLYKRSLAIREKTLGYEHISTAKSISSLAAIYNFQGRYREAEPLFKRGIAFDEKHLGPNDPSVATSLNNLAWLYYSEGRYPEAEPLYRRAIAICELTRQPGTATIIGNAAELYASQGRYTEAEPLGIRALALNQKRIGVQPEIDPFVKTAERKRFNMVVPLENLSRFELSQTGGAKNKDSINLSGEKLQSLAHGSQSEIECLKLLELNPRAEVMSRLGSVLIAFQKNVGSDDPRTAEVLMQLGILREGFGGSSKKQANAAYEVLGKFGRALCDTTNGASFSQNGFDISTITKSMGGDEVAKCFVGNALLCLGNLLAANGEIEKAKQSFNLSEKCFLKSTSSNESNLVRNLLSLSESWMNLGDYARAQELATNASNCATNKIAKYDCAVFDARLKLEQGDYSGAFEGAKSSLTAGTEAVSTLNSEVEKSQALLDSYNILIESALSMNKLKEAKEYVDQALQLKELSKQGKAYLLVLQGSIDFQEGSYEQAQKNLEAAEGKNDLDRNLDQTTFTQAAAIKGFVLEHLGKLTEAQRSLGWALNWDKNNPSSEGLLATARACNGLALIEIDRVAAKDKDGDVDRAKYYVLDGSQRIDKYIKTAFPGLSIGQQCAFLSIAKQQRDAILTTCQKKESIGPAYSMMMRWKGLLLESLRTRGAIKTAVQDNPDLKQKQEQLENKIRLLASLANKGDDTAGDETKEQYRKETAERERLERENSATGDDTAGGNIKEQYRRETAERERLEREISAASGVVLKDPLSDMGVDTFRGLLKSDEAFIDILPYKPLNEESERYAIVAMKSGPNGEPQFFDLGKRKEIDEIVRNWRFGCTGSKTELQRDIHPDKDESTPKGALKQLIDGPTAQLSDLLLTNAKLQEYLGSDVKRLWLCPEGELGRVPWTAIALLRGIKNLSISEVDSPRQFAFLRMDKSTIASDKQKKASKILLAGLSDFQKAGLNNLDGALKEVETLKKLADKFQRDVDYLPEYDATKESVKSKLTTVANAHIATHGFAGTNNSASDVDHGSRAVRFTMRQDGVTRLATARNPLSECGIYLAYPKADGDTASGDQAPNILTADEIIGLDLSKCDILTLSACETGLGRTLSGQGVIGLRSAIIGAGAKSVLMSLWSVPDDATQELMKRFYSNLWKEGMNKRDALADAQAYIRQKAQWKDPINWAAWVLVGE